MQRKRSQNLGRLIDMKQYTVEITNEALADMDQLYNHIAYVLQAPENAMNQYNLLTSSVLTPANSCVSLSTDTYFSI